MERTIIRLTEAAIQKIRAFQDNDERTGMAVRIAVREDGPAAFQYTLQFVPRSDKAAEDEAVDVDGVLLYIEGESVPRLEGTTLDFVEQVDRSGFKFDNPNLPPLLQDPVAKRVHQILEEKINPGVASHGGHVTLMDVSEGKVYLKLGGGCQGCGMVDVTLRQGIETTLRAEIPEITEVLDTTDHASGTNPYYEPDK